MLLSKIPTRLQVRECNKTSEFREQAWTARDSSHIWQVWSNAMVCGSPICDRNYPVRDLLKLFCGIVRCACSALSFLLLQCE